MKDQFQTTPGQTKHQEDGGANACASTFCVWYVPFGEIQPYQPDRMFMFNGFKTG